MTFFVHRSCLGRAGGRVTPPAAGWYFPFSLTSVQFSFFSPLRLYISQTEPERGKKMPHLLAGVKGTKIKEAKTTRPKQAGKEELYILHKAQEQHQTRPNTTITQERNCTHTASCAAVPRLKEQRSIQLHSPFKGIPKKREGKGVQSVPPHSGHLGTKKQAKSNFQSMGYFFCTIIVLKRST